MHLSFFSKECDLFIITRDLLEIDVSKESIYLLDVNRTQPWYMPAMHSSSPVGVPTYGISKNVFYFIYLFI